MIRYLAVFLIFLLASGFITFIAYAIVRTVNELPWNPFKWAQERRRRANAARARHISRLEHELDYRPCSDESCLSPECIVAGSRKTIPTFDMDTYPRPARYEDLSDTTRLAYAKQAYSKALDMDVDMYYDYAKRSYVINTKRNGMAMSNVIPEEALRDFELENYALLQNLTRPAPPPPTAQPATIRK